MIDKGLCDKGFIWNASNCDCECYTSCDFSVMILWCWKSTKKITKSLIFITLDALQLKKSDDCENIYSINPLYLLVNHASGYIVEKNWNKYLIFDESVNENKGLLKNIQMFGMKLKTKSKQ